MIYLTCIKSLYKSTYKRNAFTKRKKYEFVLKDGSVVWVKDTFGYGFTFATDDTFGLYKLSDYFSAKSIQSLNKLLLLL